MRQQQAVVHQAVRAVRHVLPFSANDAAAAAAVAAGGVVPTGSLYQSTAGLATLGRGRAMTQVVTATTTLAGGLGGGGGEGAQLAVSQQKPGEGGGAGGWMVTAQLAAQG